MAQPQGSTLYVNLPASQVRRRLKGFGHGVRKIQSGGRNKAIVIHTAAGRNLQELEAKFADVGCSSSAEHLSEPIENLRNLGKGSAAWLRLIGVHTIAELQRTGPIAVYSILRFQRPEVTENLLWAMVCGLQDRDWRDLSDHEKIALRHELAEHEEH
jgi:DNA transformation protein